MLWFPLLLLLLFTQTTGLDYAQPGAYQAGTMEFTLQDDTRPLTVTVWYPTRATDGDNAIYRTDILSVAGNALQNADPAFDGAPYPLVIFSHGSNGMRMQSLYFTEHLATHGFVVIAADHPGNTIADFVKLGSIGTELVRSYASRPLDVRRLVEFAESLTAQGGALEGLIDTGRLAVSGHSFGGYTAFASSGGAVSADALSSWCETPTGVADDLSPLDSFDGNVDLVCFLLSLFDTVDVSFSPVDIEPDAVLAFAPWNAPVFEDLSGVTAPTLVIVGSADRITVPERDAYSYYNRLETDWKALTILNDADHYIFVDECAPSWRLLGFDDVCSDPVWDMAEGHAIINHLSTAFLLWRLKDDADAGRVLEGVEIDNVRYFTTGKP